MKSKNIMVVLAILLVFVAMGSASAADDNGTSTDAPKEISINDNNYDTYFDSDGKIKDDSDYKVGDTLFINGSLTDKKLNFDKKVIVDGKSIGKIINTTFIISEDASGSTFKGLFFDNVDKIAINLAGEVSNINVINNIINIKGTNVMSNNSYLYGIYAIGASNFINITGNFINMAGEALGTYGIFIQPDMSGGYSNPSMNPMNYIITNNVITGDVDGSGSGGGVWGIQANSIINLTISKNQLNLKSKNFVYGIVLTDLVPSTAAVEYTMSNANISDNIIKGYGKVLYLIELFQLGAYFDNPTMNNVYSIDPANSGIFTISDNNIYGEGISAYGIASYGSRYMSIKGNNITVYGGDYTSVDKVSEVIPTGNSPIFLYSKANISIHNQVNITNNKLETNSGIFVRINESWPPTNHTYLDNIETLAVDVLNDDNYNIFFDNNGSFLANVIVKNGTLRLGNLNGKKIIINRVLTIIPVDGSSVILNSLIVLKGDASGSYIKNLFMISDSCILLIEDSDDNIFENNRIIIRNMVDVAYNSVTAISISDDSSRNKILNNDIEMTGSSNYVNSVYFYGISVGSFGYNTYDNTISGNKIVINSGYYTAGIYLTDAIRNIVQNNVLSLYGKNFVYGIAISDMSGFGANTQKSTNNQIISNNIGAKGGMIYLIQSYNALRNTIKNNNFTGEGIAVYGYAAAGALNDIVEGNNIVIKGIDSSKITDGFDSVGFGHGGIFYTQGSSNATIKNNKITSNYQKGGDYGILINVSAVNSKNIIENNQLSSDNGKKLGKDTIYSDVSSDIISGNSPKKTKISITTATIYQGKAATIKTTLKDEEGKLVANARIQLQMNGKTYSTTTDSKGIATFKVSSLKAGKFTAAASYAGSSNFLDSSATAFQTVKGIADLIVEKVKKSGNIYKITIKNQGSAKSSKVKLRVYYTKKKYKTVTVKGINKGKSLTVKVKFFKKYSNKKYTKIAYINYNKKALESKYANNKKKFKV